MRRDRAPRDAGVSQVNLSIPEHGASNAVLEVDGVNVASAVRGVEVRAALGRYTEVALDLAATSVVVNGEACLYLSARVAAVLAHYGWNPPAGAEVNERGEVCLTMPTDPQPTPVDHPV